MRTFQFTKGGLQVAVKCDLIDPKAEHMTIMEIRGAKGTEFETIFPWHVGSTLFRPQLIAWFGNYAAAWIGKEYGGAEVVDLNDPDAVKTMTITSTITNGNKANLKIVCRNSDNVIVGKQVVELSNSATTAVSVTIGFKYSFELIGEGDVWTAGSAPDAVTVDGDESVSIGITVPNPSEKYKLTLSPTITGAEAAKISVTGTKEGYANDVHASVDLAATDVQIDVLDGYSYEFAILTEGGSWTSGSAPDAVVIDKANASVDIAITVV